MGSANKTANYGLNQWQPNEYPKMEDFNRDNAAVDAALTAARSAEEYNPEGTYTVGAYCTHDGKLYKCTTAITVAEEWNAAHWTETTVVAELAGKTNIITPVPDGVASCNNLPNGLYACSSAILTDCPVPTFNGKIFVSLQSRYFQWAIDVGLQQAWYRTDGGGGWGSWIPIATATPPTEYDLPLAEGLVNANDNSSIYSKDQFGRVFIHVGITLTPKDGNILIATMPAGFRPSGAGANTAFVSTDTHVAVHSWIESDGNLWVYSPQSTGSISGQISFIAS